MYALAGVALCLGSGSAWAAVPAMQLTAKAMGGPGWRAEGINIRTLAGGQAQRLEVAVNKLRLPGVGALDRVKVDCDRLSTGPDWACPGGVLGASSKPWGDIAGRFAMRLDPTTRSGDGWLALRIGALGRARLTVVSRTGHWQARLRVAPLSVAALATRSGVLPGGWKAGGWLSVDADATGADWYRLGHWSVDGDLVGGSFSDPSGMKAADRVALTFRAAAQRGKDWRSDAALVWRRGEVLWTPWYWKTPESGPIRWKGQGTFDGAGLRLARWSLDWPGLGSANGSAALPWRRPFAGSMVVQDGAVDLKPLYADWIRPLFPPGSLGADFHATGKMDGAFSWENGRLHSLRWRVSGGGLADSQGRLALDGLQSRGDWRLGKGAAMVDWHAADLYRLPVGPLQAHFTLNDGALRLTSPITVAFLDGHMRVTDFHASLRDRKPDLRFSASLDQVSLKTLSGVLGWPPFAGQLAAIAREVRYENDDLRVNGILAARLFGGHVLVRDLRVDHLFGALPVLEANVAVQGIQLKPLTEAFHFGFINGVLDGSVNDLRLEAWRPESFSARFYTARTPGVPQRISQEAVQNLTRLGGGGGITGFFQTLFFRFFHEFSYARLGMSVRLHGDLAELGGVAPKDGGFYLLEGEGLPRVDVVGYNRQISWSELLSRLKAALRAGPAVTPAGGSP